MDLFAQKRTLFFIVGGVALAAIIGGVIYFIGLPSLVTGPSGTSKTETSSGDVGRLPSTQNRENGGTGLPVGGNTDGGTGQAPLPNPEEKLVALADFSTLGLSLSKDGRGVQFYKKNGGDLYLADANGQTLEKMSNITVVGLMNAVWSPSLDRAAVFYADNDAIKSFLHTGSSSVSVLPNDIAGLAWSPNGQQLAYLLKEGAQVNIFEANASGGGAKKIFGTPLVQSSIAWITQDELSIMAAPSGFAEGYVGIYSRAKKTTRKIADSRYGLTALWSPGGSRVLVGSTEQGGKNPSLSVFDSAGKELFQLTLKTLPEKCAWIGETEVLCGVPTGDLFSSILPDDYMMGVLNTTDRIVRVNLADKTAQELFNGAGRAFDISTPVISSDRTNLFFINRVDGIPWRFKLTTDTQPAN